MKGDKFDAMAEFKKLVESKGFRVNVNSEYCKKYKETHETCHGCESEDGCDRYCAISLVMLESIIYKPSSYDDFMLMNRRISEKIQRILDKNTTKEELKNITTGV